MTRAPFGDPTGEQLVDGINSRFKSLFDAASLPLTNVAGTANDVTATVVPALDGDGLLDGMSFTITWAEENTGPMTLALNGGPPVPVLGADSGGLPPGSVGPNLRSLVSYVGGDFVLLSQSLLAGGAGAARYYWVFESSGTWEKPEGLPANTPVYVAGWGGGGGGGSSSNNANGGGGGAYNQAVFRAGDLPDTVTVIVADGGAVNANGGDSTFGAFLTAYGGERGYSSGNGGGAGGGSNQNGGSGGRVGGGRGGDPTIEGDDGRPGSGGDARTLWGGGGGGGTTDQPRPAYRRGGWAVFGGGGGATRGRSSSGNNVGGVSVFGGDGGASDQAGQAPAGAGGGRAAGARGEIRIWI